LTARPATSDQRQSFPTRRSSDLNKGQKAYKFGLRIYMDVYVISNDGALFAVPNQPGKILDGVVLKDKLLPDYIQLLERPNLKDPDSEEHTSELQSPDHLVCRLLL